MILVLPSLRVGRGKPVAQDDLWLKRSGREEMATNSFLKLFSSLPGDIVYAGRFRRLPQHQVTRAEDVRCTPIPPGAEPLQHLILRTPPARLTWAATHVLPQGGRELVQALAILLQPLDVRQQVRVVLRAGGRTLAL